MLSSRAFKLSPFIILTLLNLSAAAARAEGGTSGGGGDASESRVDEIRADILKWISEGGAKGLRLPSRLTTLNYWSSMATYLTPGAVIVGFVTTAQEKETDDPELKVSVDGQPKTCRGFFAAKDGRPHILCNVERFAAIETADEEYRLIHHEYAGLAGVEQNRGAASDYEISNQMTEHLSNQLKRMLAVKRPQVAQKPKPPLPACVIWATGSGLYVLQIAGKDADYTHYAKDAIEARNQMASAGACRAPKMTNIKCEIRATGSGLYVLRMNGRDADYTHYAEDAIEARDQLVKAGACVAE